MLPRVFLIVELIHTWNQKFLWPQKISTLYIKNNLQLECQGQCKSCSDILYFSRNVEQSLWHSDFFLLHSLWLDSFVLHKMSTCMIFKRQAVGRSENPEGWNYIVFFPLFEMGVINLPKSEWGGGHCVLKRWITWTFPGNQDASLK